MKKHNKAKSFVMKESNGELFKARIRAIEKTITLILLDEFKKEQIKSEYLLTVLFMERMSKKNRLLNDVSNILVIVLSALVPVLINYSNTEDRGPSFLGWATTLSVVLAIGNAFRQSYKFREKWQNYLRTTELLLVEGQNYFALAGSYAKFLTHEEGYIAFVTAIGKLRLAQLNDFLASINSESDSIIQQRITDQLSRQMEMIKHKESEAAKIKQIGEEINAFVKSVPAISYHETDHALKTITLFLNSKTYTPPVEMKFKGKGLSDDSYKIVTKQSEVVIHRTFGPSSDIKNQKMPDQDFGSAGCLCLQGGSVVFLTCYHVVKHDSQDWDLFVPGDFDVIIGADGTPVGHILEARKSETLDVAIVQVSDEISFERKLAGTLALKDELVFLNEGNLSQYQEVFIISRMRQFRKIEGQLAFINQPITMDYGTKQQKDMKDLDGLMIIHSIEDEPFSKVGDSGSLVFTREGIPIGIVVGGDGVRCSFAMPFSIIADTFSLSTL